MKPFHTIAIPHDDILQGRLTLDVFAADLWEVRQQRSPAEYRDADTFFRKTYLTQGLESILQIVGKRLAGQGGDPVIQIQTPFGGGKTHALIAMYHKAEAWNARKIVVVGTALSPDTTLWGHLEQQLTGVIVRCPGPVAPGKEALRQLLAEHQPVLILMDEVLEYVARAAGVKVADSTLAAQTIAFMQELTEAVSTLEQVCCVVTLPASLLEHYDESAEKLFQQLQKVSGRVEKIYTPVQEHEIASIVRRRLFSDINLEAAKEVVTTFVEYAEKEDVLPAGTPPNAYRDRFCASYPFLPEVLDVLYHRWGSFHTFQRTRGVLRLLSLVIYALKASRQPYLSLADFDLANQEIRQELLKHIGPEFNSIIGADITDAEAGSKKVNTALGKAYQGLQLGARTATALFLYSFSGGSEHGATLGDLKRAATTLENPSPVVAEAVEHLKAKLFYLQNRGDRYFFSNQANLNRILLNAMENVKETEIADLELALLRKSLSGAKLKTYLWETNPANVADTPDLKLIVSAREDRALMAEVVKFKGQTPRVYRNTVLFLYPSEPERARFFLMVKRSLALKQIDSDVHLKLSEEQRKEIKQEIKSLEPELHDALRRLYRMAALPDKEGFKVKDLGLPTHGPKHLDEELYEQLKMEGDILDKIAPIVLKEKYLAAKLYVPTAQLYQATLQTPGESRPSSQHVVEHSIVEGVRMGVFGLGELREGQPQCFYFKALATVSLTGDEILIKDTLCLAQQQHAAAHPPQTPVFTSPGSPEPPTVKEPGKLPQQPPPSPAVGGETQRQLRLKFTVPKGKVSNIMGVMNLLQSKFQTLEIELIASEGEISKQDIEDKIQETFRQLGIDWEQT